MDIFDWIFPGIIFLLVIFILTMLGYAVVTTDKTETAAKQCDTNGYFVYKTTIYKCQKTVPQ